MRSLILSLVVFASFSAQAEMKPYGTLVPQLCAHEVISNSGVTAVCFSKRTGQEGQWLVLTVNGNLRQEIALPIVDIRPGNSGITGTFKSVIVTVLVEGDMVPLHGFGTPANIRSLHGDIFGRHDFNASDFDFVMTTL